MLVWQIKPKLYQTWLLEDMTFWGVPSKPSIFCLHPADCVCPGKLISKKKKKKIKNLEGLQWTSLQLDLKGGMFGAADHDVKIVIVTCCPHKIWVNWEKPRWAITWLWGDKTGLKCGWCRLEHLGCGWGDAWEASAEGTFTHLSVWGKEPNQSVCLCKGGKARKC